MFKDKGVLVTLALAALAYAVSAGVLSNKVDNTNNDVVDVKKHVTVLEKRSANHDIMFAQIIQAMNDAHVARKNTEILIKQSQLQGDGE